MELSLQVGEESQALEQQEQRLQEGNVPETVQELPKRACG